MLDMTALEVGDTYRRVTAGQKMAWGVVTEILSRDAQSVVLVADEVSVPYGAVEVRSEVVTAEDAPRLFPAGDEFRREVSQMRDMQSTRIEALVRQHAAAVDTQDALDRILHAAR